MIKGTLKKFEPLESGDITVTVKVKIEQLPLMVELYQKEVSIVPQREAIPEDRTSILKSIRDMLEKELSGEPDGVSGD